MKQLTNLMDATVEQKQQTASNKPGWCHRQLAYYFSLLCFLLTLVTLLQTLYIVSVPLMFQSQSSLQQSRLTELTHRLDSVQQAYQLLFTKYPALNLYCPVTNTTSKERKCEPCPEGWLFVGERCYLFSKDRADWISSQYHCMTLGGTLVMIRTQEEQVFLWNQAQSLSQGDSYWLGLRSSVSDGTWQWTDSTPVDRSPQFWYHVPDEERNKEMCGRLSPGDSHSYQMSWYTSSCGNHLKSICQRTQGTLQ